jgi:cytoskeletal protein RodZ
MTLGQQLRAAREQKGVGIEQAAEATKVKGDILRALEADDYSGMPAPVYSKGFLKIYAQYLGLDVQKVREQFEQASGMPSSAPPQSLHRAAARLGQSPVDRIISSMATMWGMWLLVAAILIVLFLIVWIIVSATRRAPAPAIVRTPTATPRLATNVAPVNPNAYIRPTQPRAAVLDAGKANAPTSAKAAATPAQPAPPLLLSIRLVEDSWVEVVVDGKRFPQRVMKAGTTKEWPAQKSITLRVGNAAGVQVKLNGQEQPPLGARRQTAQKTYSAAR